MTTTLQTNPVVSEITSLLTDHQRYHSNLQMDHFIVGLNGGPHPYGQYCQALRELHTRFKGVRRSYLEEQRLKAEVEEASEAPAWKRGERLLELEETQARLQDSCRELGRFLAICRALKEEVGILTPVRRDELTVAAWSASLRLKGALDSMSAGRPSRGVWEAAVALPGPAKKALLDCLADTSGLVKWARELDLGPPELGTLPAPDDVLEVVRCLSP